MFDRQVGDTNMWRTPRGQVTSFTQQEKVFTSDFLILLLDDIKAGVRSQIQTAHVLLVRSMLTRTHLSSACPHTDTHTHTIKMPLVVFKQ